MTNDEPEFSCDWPIHIVHVSELRSTVAPDAPGTLYIGGVERLPPGSSTHDRQHAIVRLAKSLTSPGFFAGTAQPAIPGPLEITMTLDHETGELFIVWRFPFVAAEEAS